MILKTILRGILLVGVLTNLLLLDWQIFTTSPGQTPNASSQFQSDCPGSCLSRIYQTIYEATTSGKTTPTESVTPTVPPTKTTYITTSTVKEFFVPFGSGSSSSSDWQDVSGLQAYVDSGYYGRIKQVLFEASVHVPTGNETAEVRLYNATDQHPVWNSEVFFTNGSNPALLVSSPMTLDGGNKLYKVQMKTQLAYPATLDQARLHIITY